MEPKDKATNAKGKTTNTAIDPPQASSKPPNAEKQQTARDKILASSLSPSPEWQRVISEMVELVKPPSVLQQLAPHPIMLELAKSLSVLEQPAAFSAMLEFAKSLPVPQQQAAFRPMLEFAKSLPVPQQLKMFNPILELAKTESPAIRRLGILASHKGTTMQAVLDACAEGRLQAEVAVVISNNANSGALQRAQAAGIPAHHISDAGAGGEEKRNLAILNCLQEYESNDVLLAGYMKKLGEVVWEEFPGRVYNTHPSLLPNYGGQGMYGNKVHEAVLAAGERETGVTMHLVDAEYDRGLVIAQDSVPVRRSDNVNTLAARVQQKEKQVLIEKLQHICA